MLHTPTHRFCSALQSTIRRGIHNSVESLMTFEGRVKGLKLSDEEKAAMIFGGDKNKYTADKLEGYLQDTSRFVSRSQDFYQIGTVKIPYKPVEPDNCCMSGCVNCVWMMYQDDIQHWKQQRRIAAKQINKTSAIWPQELKPPIHILDEKNIPESMRHLKREAKKKRLSSFQFPPLLNKNEERRSIAEAEAKAAEEAASAQEAEEDFTPEFIKQFTRFEKRKAEEKLHKIEEEEKLKK